MSRYERMEAYVPVTDFEAGGEETKVRSHWSWWRQTCHSSQAEVAEVVHHNSDEQLRTSRAAGSGVDKQ